MTDRIKWGAGRRDFFKQFMRFEIDRSLGARSELEKKWQEWLEQYRAPQSIDSTHFPFEGAHNLTIPLTAMSVDPILARYMANVHAPENLWTLKPLNERWIKQAKPLQDFLTWIDKNILHMWDVDMRAFIEMLKLGTSVYKSSWQFNTRNVQGYDAQQKRTRLTRQINRPLVDHVHIANFLVPPEAREVDPDRQGGAAWVAERHRIRVGELRAQAKGQEPFLPNYDPAETEKALRWWENNLTEEEKKRNELDGIGDNSSFFREGLQVELWECHVRFDTTGNGIEDDIIVIFHKDTHSILQAVYNWLPERPYSVIRYLRGDGFYGQGICEQSEVFQKTYSAVLNYDLDKLLLSNAPMFAYKEGANVLPDEPIFPGKLWALNEPKNDLVPLQMLSQGNFDMAQMLSLVQELGQQHVGVTDLQFGTVGALPSRTPATTVQSLLQEGNTRFDMSIKDIRQEGLGTVGLRVLQNLQFQTQNFTNNPFAQVYLQAAPQILGEPEGQEVVRALSAVPGESIETGIGVSLTATSGANNKELMKQSNLALLQLGAQMGEQFINLATLIQQGGLPGEVAQQLFTAGSELFLRTLEQFDVRDPERLAPNLQTLLNSQQQMGGGSQFNPLAQQQGAGGPQGAPQF